MTCPNSKTLSSTDNNFLLQTSDYMMGEANATLPSSTQRGVSANLYILENGSINLNSYVQNLTAKFESNSSTAHVFRNEFFKIFVFSFLKCFSLYKDVSQTILALCILMARFFHKRKMIVLVFLFFMIIQSCLLFHLALVKSTNVRAMDMDLSETNKADFFTLQSLQFAHSIFQQHTNTHSCLLAIHKTKINGKNYLLAMRVFTPLMW